MLLYFTSFMSYQLESLFTRMKGNEGGRLGFQYTEKLLLSFISSGVFFFEEEGSRKDQVFNI